MPSGRVRSLHERKRFGFIARPAPFEDVFFHKSDAPTDVAIGEDVVFAVEYGDRGPRAVRVERA